MAARRREVDLLNTAARRRPVADGTLSGPDLAAAGRHFAVGDEVVTLTRRATIWPATAPPATAYAPAQWAGSPRSTSNAVHPKQQCLATVTSTPGPTTSSGYPVLTNPGGPLRAVVEQLELASPVKPTARRSG